MTFIVGAEREGEGTDMPTPDANTPCRAAAKVWRAESKRPRAVRPVYEGRPNGCTPPPGGTHPPDRKPCVERGDRGGGLGG